MRRITRFSVITLVLFFSAMWVVLAQVEVFDSDESLGQQLAGEDFSKLDSRFADLLQSPHLHAYLAMNNAEDVCRFNGPCRNKGKTNPHISYDAKENAFKVDTLGESDISSRWQIRKYFPQLDKTNAKKVSFQWEFKYGEGYLDTGSLHNYKSYQISNAQRSLMWEEQCNFFRTRSDVVCLPTNRYYWNWSLSEMSKNEPISSGRGPSGVRMDNRQPGGETAANYKEFPFGLADHLAGPAKPFLITANEWHRLTLEFTFASKQLRVKKWLQSESSPTTLVLDSMREPGRGFLLSEDTDATSLSFQNWWLELNTSQDVRVPGLVSWHKNFVVYKDAEIPLE